MIASEMDALQSRIEAAGMPTEAKEKAQTELNKLKNMAPMSAEATVVRFVDWMLNIPWSKRSRKCARIWLRHRKFQTPIITAGPK